MSKLGRAAASAASSIGAAGISKVVSGHSGFNWANIAASAASASIGGTLPGEVNTSGFANDLLMGSAGRTVGYGVNRAFGGDRSWNGRDVVVDVFGNAIGNSIVGQLQKQPKPKVQDPDTGKSSPSLVGEFDVMAAAAAQKQKAVDLSQQQNTNTVAPVQRGSVNDALIEDLGAAYFAENPLYSFDLKTDLSDFVYDVPKYLRRPMSPNSESLFDFDKASYGAGLLGVAAGISKSGSITSGKISSIGVVDDVLSTFPSLSSYKDGWSGVQKPLVPSFEEFRLQSLQTDIFNAKSLDHLDNLSSYKFNPDLATTNVNQWANKLQPFSKWLGGLGTVASVGGVGLDMASAYQKSEDVSHQLLASTTNVAIEAGGSWAAFKLGAVSGTAISAPFVGPFSPAVGLVTGTLAAGGFSYGYNYDFTDSPTGANSWSSQFKTLSKEISQSHDNYETYKKNNPSIWNHIVR
ncbi:MAG: hypothetical protein HRT38_19235 [Alteromonadaceae bacterium]|nr:hypothetical protein [Alteromonadaceae bacterium]